MTRQSGDYSVVHRLLHGRSVSRRHALIVSDTGEAAVALAACTPTSAASVQSAATSSEELIMTATRPTSPSITPAEPSSTAAAAPVEPVGLSGIVFPEDYEFDGQFVRALDTIYDGGADIGECFSTARRIVPGDDDNWLAEWTATADRVFAGAAASQAAGHRISANEGFLRAVTYYRTAGIFMYKPPLDPRFVTANRRQREAFQRAAEVSDYSIETVQIPYESTSLEAYFIVPTGNGPFRTLVIVDGYDGTKEELYFSGGVAALRRGYAVLLVDGPGQGAPLIEQGLFFRPDWETVVTPQIDWLLNRPEVDPKRIALMGRSFGGYLAPRAATAEHRIAALIADAPQFSLGKHAPDLLPPEYRDQIETGDPTVLNNILTAEMEKVPAIAFSLNRGMLTHGVATPLDYLKAAPLYTLEGLAQNITCPTLVCSGENDVRGGDAQPLLDGLVAPKKYLLFTNAEGAGEHDEAGAAALFSQRVFDWLDETLAQVG